MWTSDLSKLAVKFPTTHNRTSNFDPIIVDQDARATHIVIHPRFPRLVEDFLTYKRAHGSVHEKALYATPCTFSWQDETSRLISKRPLMFMGSSDATILRDGTHLPNARTEWDRNGTDQQHANKHLTLDEYLSYDEIMLSSLTGVSGPTFFINDGNRFNHAQPGLPGSFHDRGVIIGLVGARFERADRMDSVHVLSPIAGPRQPSALTKLFYDFFGEKRDTERSFDVAMYKARMRITAEILLLEANSRAKEAGSTAYVYVVGLGLGVWQRDSGQAKWYIETFALLLERLALSNISTIEFAWIDVSEEVRRRITTVGEAKKIVIKFSKRQPVARLDSQELLVLSYAWDGNAFPGNEYWGRMLATSGDPAAACMSTIAEVHNPILNPDFVKRIRVVGDDMPQ